jgi:hypothetical protein
MEHAHKVRPVPVCTTRIIEIAPEISGVDIIGDHQLAIAGNGMMHYCIIRDELGK